MKKHRFTEEQIAFVLRQADAGTPVAEVVRKSGISEQTFYRWKKKYAGLGVAELRRLKQLEEENRRLKQMVADLSLNNEPIQNMPAQLDSGELVKRGGEYIRKYFKMSKSAIIAPVGVRKYVYAPWDMEGNFIWNISKIYMTCAYELDKLEKKAYYVISLDCANGKVIDEPYDGPPTRRPAPKAITPKVLAWKFANTPPLKESSQ